MIRGEYAIDICARLGEAKAIPFEPVAIGHWRPKESCCHANVDAWVAANPGAKAVRGWLEHVSYGGDIVGLTAHSVVENAAGRRFDITPFQPGSGDRERMRFVQHLGDDKSFFAIKPGTEVQCLNGIPAPKLTHDDLRAGADVSAQDDDSSSDMF